MRTSGILTIGGAFVAILGSAFALLMLRAFFVDKGQGFVDLSGLVVGGVVAAVGLGLVAAGRKRARMEHEHDELHFSEMAFALAKKNGAFCVMTYFAAKKKMLKPQNRKNARNANAKGPKNSTRMYESRIGSRSWRRMPTGAVRAPGTEAMRSS